MPGPLPALRAEVLPVLIVTSIKLCKQTRGAAELAWLRLVRAITSTEEENLGGRISHGRSDLHHSPLLSRFVPPQNCSDNSRQEFFYQCAALMNPRKKSRAALCPLSGQ